MMLRYDVVQAACRPSCGIWGKDLDGVASSFLSRAVAPGMRYNFFVDVHLKVL